MNDRGVTLVEVLITTVISAIALMALAVPFAAERNMWGVGRRQTEAQRDAQFSMRAIAREVRESTNYSISANELELDIPDCGVSIFERQADTLRLHRCDGAEIELIDGLRSRVVEFLPQELGPALIRIQLRIAHHLNSGNLREEDEVMVTDIMLRNVES